jgi:hypothetical protein
MIEAARTMADDRLRFCAESLKLLPYPNSGTAETPRAQPATPVASVGYPQPSAVAVHRGRDAPGRRAQLLI